jgi:hypothetical protein
VNAAPARAQTAGPPPSRLVRRLPLLALALVSLIAGLWAGLLRLGVDLPAFNWSLVRLHGPLMVFGFLGTQIGLERAVALRRRWPYLVPAAAGAGSLWLLLGLPEVVGQALLAVAGLLLVLVFVVVHRIEPSWHNTIMGLGAASWAVGAIAWLAGALLIEVVPWLAAFLVLTIVGERLELSRMARPPGQSRLLLLAGVAVFLGGLVLAWPFPTIGIRIAGAGLVAQVVWLVRCDIARRTIRQQGATRFMAAALLAGYAWLGLGGLLWIFGAPLSGGFAYDAMLHTVFLGFVFSMIFAHAPVIIPAVLGVKLPWRSSFYLPLALLHGSLVVRIVGDAAQNIQLWRIGGILGEVAIVLYLALAASSAVRAARAPSARPVSAAG